MHTAILENSSALSTKEFFLDIIFFTKSLFPQGVVPCPLSLFCTVSFMLAFSSLWWTCFVYSYLSMKHWTFELWTYMFMYWAHPLQASVWGNHLKCQLWEGSQMLFMETETQACYLQVRSLFVGVLYTISTFFSWFSTELCECQVSLEFSRTNLLWTISPYMDILSWIFDWRPEVS